MKNPKSKLYSVITADIVNSSKLTIAQHKKLISIVKKCSLEIQKIHPSLFQYTPEYFRGDSWQLVLKKPEFALEVVLFYRAFLRAKMKNNTTDARMAISIGSIEYVKKHFGVGEAYKISGETLDLKGKRRLKFVFNDNTISNFLDLIVENSDFISSKWTFKQSQIIVLALSNFNQLKIADKIKISQQAVSQQLDSAGWSVISRNMMYFKQTVLNLNNNMNTSF